MKLWKDKTYIMMAVVILITAVFYGVICLSHNLWYDEAYTIALIKHNIKDIVRITSNDVHTPLYYLFAKAFYNMFGLKEIGVKLFSLICHIIYMGGMAFFVTKIWNKRIALFSLIIGSLYVPMLIHSTEGRMYSFSMMCFTYAFFFGIMSLKKSKAYLWILFTLFSVLAMYAHIFTMLAMFFTYIIFGIYILIKLKKNKEYKSQLIWIFVSAFVSAIAYVPWLSVVIKQTGRVSGSEDYLKFGLKSIFNCIVHYFTSEWNPSFMAIIIWAIIFIITLSYSISVIIKGFKSKGSDKDNEEGTQKENIHPEICLMMLLIVFLPTFFGIVFSMTVQNIYMGRYTYPMLGLMFVLGAISVQNMKKVNLYMLGILLLIVVSLPAYVKEYRRVNDKGMDVFRTYIKENACDDDIYIVEGLHTSLISLELEGKKVLTPGETKVYNPFPIEGYTTWEELGEPSHIYYISLEEPEYIWFFAEYPTEKVLDFNYMMYHFVVNKVDYR